MQLPLEVIVSKMKQFIVVLAVAALASLSEGKQVN